jgi:hypothetical protein
MPYIEEYTFGMATIDGHSYTSDLKIFPDKVKSNWWREQGHELHIADIADVLVASPEVIIIGTGASGAMKVPDKVRVYIESLGIEFSSLPTREAIYKHNTVSQDKMTITCLHLTC